MEQMLHGKSKGGRFCSLFQEIKGETKISLLIVALISSANYHLSHILQVANIRGVATGGISVYIPPKSVYLKKFMRVFFSSDPGQILYCL